MLDLCSLDVLGGFVPKIAGIVSDELLADRFVGEPILLIVPHCGNLMIIWLLRKSV